MNNYIELAKRTDKKDYESSEERLEHGVMGLCTETGEIMDVLKRKRYYKKPIDRTNLLEELGDIFWYCAIMLDELGSSFDEVMELNIKKLQARYPEKFTEEAALNRDLNKERKILERVE